MTLIPPGHPTKRETAARYKGRALLVELHPGFLTIKEKGRRFHLAVDYNTLYEFAWKLRWKREQAEKKKGRKP